MPDSEFRFQAPQRTALLKLLPPEGVDDLEDACSCWICLPGGGAKEEKANHWRSVLESAAALQAALQLVDLADISVGISLEGRSHFELVRDIVARGYGNRFLHHLLSDLMRAADWCGAYRAGRRGPGAPMGNLSTLVAFCAAVAMRFDVVKRPSRSSKRFMDLMGEVFTGLKEPNGPTHAVKTFCEIPGKWAGDMFGTRSGGAYSIQHTPDGAWTAIYGPSEASFAAAFLSLRGEPVPGHASRPQAVVRISRPRSRCRESAAPG